MSSNRIEVLKTMAQQDPGNPFALYGLAIEYVNSGRHEDAAGEFDGLMKNHPDYVPAYFHAGRNLEKLGRLEEARAVLEKGIDVTTRKGDAHTRSELQAALDMLGI